LFAFNDRDTSRSNAFADPFLHRFHPVGFPKQRLPDDLLEWRPILLHTVAKELRVLTAGTPGMCIEVAEHFGHRQEARNGTLTQHA
jgi:hypothetical protein